MYGEAHINSQASAKKQKEKNRFSYKARIEQVLIKNGMCYIRRISLLTYSPSAET